MKRLALVAALALAFFAGLVADHAASASRRPAAQRYRPLDVFANVLSDIQDNYVEEVAEQDLVYGAIDGMVARLDPHSLFMRPDVYRQAGAQVSLEIMRQGFTTPQRLALVRDRIRTQSVEWRVLDADRRYLYLRVR